MKRILPRYVYSSIVGIVSVTMVASPASGGWLLHKLRCHKAAKHASHGCEPVCETVSSHEPVSCCAPVMEVATDSCRGSSESMMMGGEVIYGEVSSEMSSCCGDEGMAYEGEIIHDGGMMQDGMMMHQEPMTHEGAMMGDMMMGDAVIDSMPMHDMSMEPMMEAPSIMQPSEPMPMSSSDIVAPTDTAPAKTPEPAMDTKPADPKPAAPEPAPAEDDLFGTPPAEPAPMPAAEPAMDDLFGEPPVEPAAPAAPAEPAEPAAPSGLDDLFGEPAAPAADAPAADDIFGAPPSAEAPAVEPAAAPGSESIQDSLDDLFGSTRVRVWIDNSGEYSTEARLIEVGSGFIRLMKANGRTCTVTNDRLCAADSAYVAAVTRNHSDVKVAMVSGR